VTLVWCSEINIIIIIIIITIIIIIISLLCNATNRNYTVQIQAHCVSKDYTFLIC